MPNSGPKSYKNSQTTGNSKTIWIILPILLLYCHLALGFLLAEFLLQPGQECLGIGQAPPCVLLHFLMPDFIAEIHDLGRQVAEITALLNLLDGTPVVVAFRPCLHIGV